MSSLHIKEFLYHVLSLVVLLLRKTTWDRKSYRAQNVCLSFMIMTFAQTFFSYFNIFYLTPALFMDNLCLFRVGAVESGSMDITCAATSQVRVQVERLYCIIIVLVTSVFCTLVLKSFKKLMYDLTNKYRQELGRSGDLVSTESR